MLDSPPTRGKTLRKRKPDSHANRQQPGFGTTSAAQTPSRNGSSACGADGLALSIKAELALWRAFLREEIDALLFDRD
jgi:hypothetical protein